MSASLSWGAIILAGGRSSRMGQHKAFLRFGAETLLQKVINQLPSPIQTIVIVFSRTQTIPPLTSPHGATLLFTRDHTANQGPLQGLADGHQELPDFIDAVLVLTCDLPYLRGSLLSQLLVALQKPYEAVLLSSDGYRNPLLASYRRAVIREAALLRERGIRKAQALVEGRMIQLVAPPMSDSEICQDMNTPEAYRRALAFHQFFDIKAPEVVVLFLFVEGSTSIEYQLPLCAASVKECLRIVAHILPEFGTQLASQSNVTIAINDIEAGFDNALHQGDCLTLTLGVSNGAIA